MTQSNDLNAPGNMAWRDNVMNNLQDRTGDEKLGSPRNLDSILRIPVQIQVVLGNATMPVASLMNLGRGAIIPLDHRVGEPVDIVVNGRVIARGEVVVVEDDNSRFGVSLTEIVGPPTTEFNG
jgi:flagellar motor switch protein FliN/FliY